MVGKLEDPPHDTFDVVIVGGAMIGSSVAWFLSHNEDFDGRILVVERDPTYGQSSTAHTNSCMRQQFSSELNIRISQFAAEFVRNFRDHMGGDLAVPDLHVHHFGYMYLADSETFASRLRDSYAVQAGCGAATKLMSPDEIAAAYPFYQLDDIVLRQPTTQSMRAISTVPQCLTGGACKARQRGVCYIANEVVNRQRCRQGD